MKQRITVEQLNELTDDQKARLREWWWGSNPNLSDVYTVRYAYEDVTRYEGMFVIAQGRDFHEDYHKGEATPLLSIGQMIELLGEKVDRLSSPYGKEAHIESGQWKVWIVGSGFWDGETKELCDALWDAVVGEFLGGIIWSG